MNKKVYVSGGIITGIKTIILYKAHELVDDLEKEYKNNQLKNLYSDLYNYIKWFHNTKDIYDGIMYCLKNNKTLTIEHKNKMIKEIEKCFSNDILKYVNSGVYPDYYNKYSGKIIIEITGDFWKY